MVQKQFQEGCLLAEIIRVARHSPAAGKLQPGDLLVSINGVPIVDVLDYQFHSYDAALWVTTRSPAGRFQLCHIQKHEGESLGLDFDSYLMDKSRPCQNRCIFCFIDQLPRGLRESLYFKDDDIRLSFLTGNYISLTNVTEAELSRIISLRISPINISVHATDPRVRTMMLGNLHAGRVLSSMARLAEAGITMNAQIVLCPGINDGAVLERSMADLAALYPQLNSVSIVPVGLTGHRAGLYPLTPFTPDLARESVARAERFAAECLTQYGSRIFHLADELYLSAGLKLPEEEAYEGYPQLENGVGLLRSFQTEFEEALENLSAPPPPAPFSLATGVSAAPFLQDLLATAAAKCGKIDLRVHAIRNEFLGPSVTVAGLVVGGDIQLQLREQDLGTRLLIPKTMLRRDEDCFLDDMTVTALSDALGVPVIPVDTDGKSFLDAIFSCT
jgi:putative radical SAM enzyme (TIGR03279 family)